MKAKRPVFMFIAGAAFLVMLPIAGSPIAAQQTPTPPVFSLSSDTAWNGIGGGELDPVPGSPKPVTQDPRYHYTPNGPEGASYRIADLTNPNLKPWVKDTMKKDNDEVLAGKIGYTPRSSCKPAGVPGFMAMGGGSLFVLQSPQEVTLVFDGNLETRHIHLNVPHTANPKPSWYGDSVGHYEGDTLVVDTIALNTKTFVDAYRTPHTDKLHVTERWRLIENGNTLEVLISVDDPDAFNQPWQAVKRYARQKRMLVENSCAENNDILFDYGTPKADKPDF
jgi:hypothetical protein